MSLHSGLLEQIEQKRQNLQSALSAAEEEKRRQNFYHCDPGLSHYMGIIKAQLNILTWVAQLIRT